MHHSQEGIVSVGLTFFWESIKPRRCLDYRIFCAVHQTALPEWRRSVISFGFDVGDSLSALLDLRFADDVLLFAKSAQDSSKLLDDLVRCVGMLVCAPTPRKPPLKRKHLPSFSALPAASRTSYRPMCHTNIWVVCCPARLLTRSYWNCALRVSNLPNAQVAIIFVLTLLPTPHAAQRPPLP